MDFRTPEDLLGLGKKIPFRPGMMGSLAGLFALVVALATMFYTIDTDERGVVLFLGKYVRTTTPGLHMKWPFGIETVTPVKVEKIFKEEFGFRTTRPGVRSQYSPRSYLDESLMLTGDLNALTVEWIVQFKVNDPVQLLYRLRDPVGNVRDLSETVLRQLVGDYSVDEVLTTKRAEINVEAQTMLQEILNSYESGIRVITVKLQDVTVPDKVKPAFNEVNEAKQEKERVINQALREYNKVIPKARGQAEQTILQADAYAVERVNISRGDANRFLAVLTEYQRAPLVTRKRLYLETTERVLAQSKKKYIIDPAQQGILPLLDLREGDGS